jgi:isoquinoline 1-oxidoreductase alpha subunit
MINLRVNGKTHQVNVDPETPLLWVLNEQLGLTGTKYSCGIAECGACSVFIDGEVSLSCNISVGEVENSEVVTIEGLQGAELEAIKESWIEEDVPQCGYCQPGQVITATALLKENPRPSDDDIDEAMSVVLCRCGTYRTIKRAIHSASRRLDEK